MEETYQLTGALKYLPFGKQVAVLTDARFSGVSTGACIGHVTPEALAGGPIGKLRDGDLIEIVIDRRTLEGSVNFVGEAGVPTRSRRRLADPVGASVAARSRTGSGLAGRHAHLGGAAGRQRRRLGRLRDRRRRRRRVVRAGRNAGS